MTCGLVFGPTLAALAGDARFSGRARVHVRSGSETPAGRAAALRGLFSEGVDTVVAVDRAFPVRLDWLTSGRLFALVTDHINLTGDNPLVGPNDDAWGPRFPDMTDAWDPALRASILEAVVGAGIAVVDGVVAGVSGPSRTAAELDMLRTVGADMASDGFAYEAIVSRHAGRRIAGIALLSLATELPGETDRLGAVVSAALDAVERTAVDA